MASREKGVRPVALGRAGSGGRFSNNFSYRTLGGRSSALKRRRFFMSPSSFVTIGENDAY
jgi:hypothetical protein